MCWLYQKLRKILSLSANLYMNILIFFSSHPADLWLSTGSQDNRLLRALELEVCTPWNQESTMPSFPHDFALQVMTFGTTDLGVLNSTWLICLRKIIPLSVGTSLITVLLFAIVVKWLRRAVYLSKVLLVFQKFHYQ